MKNYTGTVQWARVTIPVGVKAATRISAPFAIREEARKLLNIPDSVGDDEIKVSNIQEATGSGKALSREQTVFLIGRTTPEGAMALHEAHPDHNINAIVLGDADPRVGSTLLAAEIEHGVLSMAAEAFADYDEVPLTPSHYLTFIEDHLLSMVMHAPTVRGNDAEFAEVVMLCSEFSVLSSNLRCLGVQPAVLANDDEPDIHEGPPEGSAEADLIKITDLVAVCNAEGWGVFSTGGAEGHAPWEIQYLQEDEILMDDYEAWDLVWRKAQLGDGVHRKVISFLAKHSPAELERITLHCMGLGNE